MCLPDCRVCCGFIQLEIDEFLNAVPQLHHTLDAGFGGIAQVGLHHAAVFPVVHLAVKDRIGIIFDVRIGRQRAAGPALRFAQFVLLRLGDLSLNMGNCLVELCGEVGAGERFAGRFHFVAVHAVVPFDGPEHHLRVVGKVAVDGNSVLGLAEMHPVRFGVVADSVSFASG